MGGQPDKSPGPYSGASTARFLTGLDRSKQPVRVGVTAQLDMSHPATAAAGLDLDQLWRVAVGRQSV